MKYIVGFIFLTLAIQGISQESPNYYVQFKVNSVASEADAQSIDRKMSGKKGIISTNTDHVTSTFFCTMTGDAEYVFEDFESWFNKMGFTIVCFNMGVQGDGKMKSPHALKNCEVSNNE